jgi:phosphatidylserine decarboxylase
VPSAVLALASIVAAPLLGSWVAWVLLALAGANLAFFRNPRRTPPPGEGCVVAAADGRVVEVARVEDPEGFVGSAWRVSVFLSIFNVHVQRAPLSGKVRAVRAKGTRFLAAFNPRASEHNVQTRVDLETEAGRRIAVVQIAGLVARRIFCYVEEGEELVRGKPYGLICYGSRVELYLPANATVRVAPGDRVRAGQTLVAEVQP